MVSNLFGRRCSILDEIYLRCPAVKTAKKFKLKKRLTENKNNEIKLYLYHLEQNVMNLRSNGWAFSIIKNQNISFYLTIAPRLESAELKTPELKIIVTVIYYRVLFFCRFPNFKENCKKKSKIDILYTN